MSLDPRPTSRAELATMYQREAADDASRARLWLDAGDLAGAVRNQRFAAATAAKARQLQGIES